MKFQPDRLDGVNTVSVFSASQFGINGQTYEGSLVVPWRGEVQAWRPTTFTDLVQADFDQLLALSPELVIFGSGPRQKFVSPAMTRTLIERRIGVECMDTAAACRTYNVLVTEGRQVLGVFLAA